jgi:hypothetical protein
MAYPSDHYTIVGVENSVEQRVGGLEGDVSV